jgi:glycerol transport system ATP-binding protein
VLKQGAAVMLSDSVQWPTGDRLRELPDGRYIVGVRPHCITAVANGRASAAVDGTVLITELSGSESTIHFAHGPLNWVSQSHGIHAAPVGSTLKLYVDVDRCMYFSADGRLVA